MPCVAVAGGDVCGGAVVDGKVQCCHRVAPGCIGICVGRGIGAGGVGCTLPHKAIAGCDGLHGGIAIVYGECQCVGAVGIGAAGSVGGSMPCVAVAGGDICGGTVVDGEVQCRHRVASGRIGTCVCRCAGAGSVL